MKIMSESNLLCASDLAYYAFRNKPSEVPNIFKY